MAFEEDRKFFKNLVKVSLNFTDHQDSEYL
jgi:hypothetical protein